jgi:phospholipid/cholesterol/gamma-HCH transport system substrate-binding protein
MTRVLTALVVLALLGAGTYLLAAPEPTKSATAYFDTAGGIHVDDEVRVLNVRVGSVDEIQPEGTRVRVRFHYDADRKVPEEVSVALVAPTLVSGRYLQLAPVYRGGPVLGDGAVIPESRTAEPAEWDQVNAELTKLAEALGPNGANREGAVSRLLETGAANLGGNGEELSRMLRALSGTSATLAAGGDDLFGTIRDLDQITTALNASQGTMRTFATQLASISGLANDNRARLAEAMSAADRALSTITDFLARHKGNLGDTVVALTEVAANLARSQDDLANILHTAPQTMANLYNIYEPSTGSASTRLMLPYSDSMSTLVCQSIFSVGGTIDTCRTALEPLLSALDMPYPPVAVDPLQRPGTSHQRSPGEQGGGG